MIGKEQTPDIGKDTQFKEGQSGNPKGRPKGRKSLSTIIRDIGEQQIDWKKIPVTAKSAEQLKSQFGDSTPFEAIVLAAFKEALTGYIPAMEWLRRAGYGDKLNVEGTASIGLFNADKIIIEPVESESKSEATDSPEFTE